MLRRIQLIFMLSSLVKKYLFFLWSDGQIQSRTELGADPQRSAEKNEKINQTANDETMRTYKNMAAKTRRANQTHMKPHSIAVGGATDSMETLWLMGSYDRHGIIQLYRHAKDATATFLSHHAVLPGGVEAHRRRLSGKVNTGSNAELPGSSEPQDDVTHNLQ